MSATEDIDMDQVHNCVARARGVAEMIGPYAITTFGYDTAMPLNSAVWSIIEELDRIAKLTGLQLYGEDTE